MHIEINYQTQTIYQMHCHGIDQLEFLTIRPSLNASTGSRAAGKCTHMAAGIREVTFGGQS